MAKSNLQLLQEALASGDIEKATQLTNKIAKSGKLGKAKTKIVDKGPNKPTKASKAKVAVSTQAKPKRAAKSQPGASKAKKHIRHDIDASVLDESEYLAPSRRAGEDGFSGRKFIGADGKEHTYARRVSMAGMTFANKFNPDDYSPLPSRHATLEKKLKKLKSVPKPGQRGAARDKSAKIKVRCVICRDMAEVYPWEADTVDEEGLSNFRCSKKSCVKAR